MFKKASEVYEYLVPPTKLKNSRLLKPFEALVKMYGVPGYYEADPTAFLGITYMVLFGAMFGDLGQGFVLMLAGFWQEKKRPGASGGYPDADWVQFLGVRFAVRQRLRV